MSRKGARTIEGFDYCAGKPCAHTARDWQRIAKENEARGGFTKSFRGEKWLFSKEHKFIFEIYFHAQPSKPATIEHTE